jgi:tight adherence protein C
VLRGNRYTDLVENLDDGDYPLKSFYTVGFALSNEVKPLRLPYKLRIELQKYASLLYGETYAQYYAEVAWAQFITLVLLIFSVILIFGSFVGGGGAVVFFVIGVIMIFVVWNMSITRMKDIVNKRSQECLDEFSDAVGKMALLINSGMVLRDAWKLTAQNPRGQLYALMRDAVDMMNNGASDIEAIYKFGVVSDSQEVKKFASTVIQTLEKGGGGLADYLLEHAASLLSAKRQSMLQKGEVASGKLIMPIGIMFAGIMLIVIAAAMQGFTG